MTNRTFPTRTATYILIAFGVAVLLPWQSSPAHSAGEKSAAQTPIDFNRQIRPILSESCFTCHGPDEKERKAKLRLDTREGGLKELRDGGFAIVPGHANKSELLVRITTKAASERMPPPKTNKRLTPEQIDLLRRWIDEGAKWSEHWAFVAPKRSPLPRVANPTWPRNAIDHFILARLERAGLKPSPEADAIRLIRRVTLDLTGLPPTPAEVDAFLADKSTNAYEKVVDRLLASPHFGERMAVEWLDAARYADTHGYHIDSGRDMTRWRDWVIAAFNENLPFDRFTVEQLAGDLLPGATVRQKVASGFNRNHMINFEGGAIPAEYHNNYIVDRVNTTSTVWLGLTTACAQCHDHKYDPISQKEYYQLYAFFHNVPENGLDGSRGNAAPVLKAPTPAQAKRLRELDAAIQETERKLATPDPKLDEAQAAWERTALGGRTEWVFLDLKKAESRGGAKLTPQSDQSLLASGPNPATDAYTVVLESSNERNFTALRLEALPHKSLKGQGPGRSVNGNIVLTDVRLSYQPANKSKPPTPIKLKAASADFSQQDFPIRNAIDADPKSGWAIYPEVGKAHSAVFEFERPVELGCGLMLTVTLDFQSQYGQHQLGCFRLSATTSANPHNSDTLPANVRAALTVPRANRTAAQEADLRLYYRSQVAAGAQLKGQLAKLRQERAEVEKQMPTTMVMQEMPTPRDTFMLLRGEYDKKGAKVTAATPASLPPLPAGAPLNRLGLAQWLVDPSHPLTARVAVNRYWQQFFGTGLVKTAEDFGAQGELPSHPELLDWVAVEFMQPTSGPLGSGGKKWDVKALVRLIVTSATYRQSSAVTPALLAKDADNRLLTRAPRLRLQAEFIRDQALAVSGLLNREIGGASVFPYQPAGLWQELASRSDSKNWSAQFFVQSHGKDLYRRTMYTFWKRTSPPPTLVTFDAPDRETCTVRRSRTNTPLQALVLLNDPTYVEASRKLAERMMKQAESTEERIIFAFRLATARRPTTKEVEILSRVFNRQLNVYRQDPKAALRLLGVGEAPRDERLPAAELAAWTVVASVILNLDETITKG
ncbi:MAG TPA: PSD1 and planctomycete cytochrome C domain-containing protein [Gemmataceae bacterium]|nr:PSD1 and planctomycete cytochrome C domain-containing protein [Gemmataceae bacterium]